MGETPDKVVLVGNLKFPTQDSPDFRRVRMSKMLKRSSIWMQNCFIRTLLCGCHRVNFVNVAVLYPIQLYTDLNDLDRPCVNG
jgi:hypothetical protein